MYKFSKFLIPLFLISSVFAQTEDVVLPDEIEVLNRSQSIINTSYSNLLASDRTRIFANHLSKVNQKLEAQSEELQTQAEELQQTSEELQEQNIELEAQRKEVEIAKNWWNSKGASIEIAPGVYDCSSDPGDSEIHIKFNNKKVYRTP